MISNGYSRSNYDICVYFEGLNLSGVIVLYLLLYVDDMVIAISDRGEIKKLKGLLRGSLR